MRRSALRAFRARLEQRYLDHCGYGSGSGFTAQLLASIGPGDVLLDAGCGKGGLRRNLPAEVLYVGLDRYAGKQKNEYKHWDMQPTVVGDVHALPLASASCKTVAMMHVLEHVKEPARALAEVSRVLQPNGYLFLDVPFLHEIHHAPHDHYRYTPYALQALARAAELEVVEVRPSGGYFRALSHILEAAPQVVRGASFTGMVIRLTIAYPLRAMGWLLRKLQYPLDLEDGTQTFTCGYHCIFRKRPHDAL